MPEPAVIKLAKPLRVVDRILSEITLREPTGRDLAKSGMPFKIEDGDAEPIADAAHQLIALCSGLPLNVVDEMGPLDWMKCTYQLIGFFTPQESEPTPSTSTSTAPDSGATTSASFSA